MPAAQASCCVRISLGVVPGNETDGGPGLRETEGAMASTDDDVRDKAMERYTRLDARFNAAGGYAAESEAHRIASNLGLDERALKAAGVRVLKIAMPWPLETQTVREWGEGLEELLVVEDKLPFLETAIKDAEDDRGKRTNPEARARAEDTATKLEAQIATLEEQATKASARGDERAAQQARDSAATYREWLAQAQQAVSDFSG